MKKELAIAAILDYFRENEETFVSCLEGLDSYNGYLGDNRYYPMEELSEFFRNTDPIDLLNCAFFGYDEADYNTDERGQRVYGPFNPNREYFTFDGYANFVSSYRKDYSAYLYSYSIEAMADHRHYIYEIDADEALSELFDQYEDAE